MAPEILKKVPMDSDSLGFLSRSPLHVVPMLRERNGQSLADISPTCSRKSRKKEGGRQRAAESVPLDSGHEQLSQASPRPCLYQVAQTHVTWQPLDFVPGNQGCPRKRVWGGHCQGLRS